MSGGAGVGLVLREFLRDERRCTFALLGELGGAGVSFLLLLLLLLS